MQPEMSEDLTVTPYRAVAFTRDPWPSDDSNQGFRSGSRWINTATNRVFLCTSSTISSAVWLCATVPTANSELLTVDLCTHNTLYTAVCSFSYKGSATAPLASVHVAARVNSENSAHTFDLRLVDTSNNDALLAEVTGLTGIDAELRDMGTLSNVPSGAALLELHVRRSGTGSNDTVQVTAVQLVFS